MKRSNGVYIIRYGDNYDVGVSAFQLASFYKMFLRAALRRICHSTSESLILLVLKGVGEWIPNISPIYLRNNPYIPVRAACIQGLSASELGIWQEAENFCYNKNNSKLLVIE